MASAVRSTALVVTSRPASTVIERCLVPDHSLHAAYSGRELCILDIQFDIDGKLPLATVRAQIVRTQSFHMAQGRQHGLAAQPAIGRLLAASASYGALVFPGGWKFEQLGQRGSTRPV